MEKCPKCKKCGSGYIYFTDSEIKCRRCGHIEKRVKVKKNG